MSYREKERERENGMSMINEHVSTDGIADINVWGIR